MLRAHNLSRHHRIVKLTSIPGQTFEVVSHGRQTLAIAKAKAGDQVWIVSEREAPLYRHEMIGPRTTRLFLKLYEQGVVG